MEDQTRQRIQKYIESHSGIIHTSDFQKSGLHNLYLARLVKEGAIIQIKPGLYISSEVQTLSGFFEIQIALPRSVICLASALAYYELTTYEPPSVHVAIPRGDRTKPPNFPPIRRFSFSSKRHQLGVTTVEIEGQVINIYDREKTICDAVRFRRALGQDVVNETIRNYLQLREKRVDLVLEYARILREETPVRTYLRISA